MRVYSVRNTRKKKKKDQQGFHLACTQKLIAVSARMRVYTSIKRSMGSIYIVEEKKKKKIPNDFLVSVYTNRAI